MGQNADGQPLHARSNDGAVRGKQSQKTGTKGHQSQSENGTDAEGSKEGSGKNLAGFLFIALTQQTGNVAVGTHG